jgi:hypothetical protein
MNFLSFIHSEVDIFSPSPHVTLSPLHACTTIPRIVNTLTLITYLSLPKNFFLPSAQHWERWLYNLLPVALLLLKYMLLPVSLLKMVTTRQLPLKRIKTSQSELSVIFYGTERQKVASQVGYLLVVMPFPPVKSLSLGQHCDSLLWMPIETRSYFYQLSI